METVEYSLGGRPSWSATPASPGPCRRGADARPAAAAPGRAAPAAGPGPAPGHARRPARSIAPQRRPPPYEGGGRGGYLSAPTLAEDRIVIASLLLAAALAGQFRTAADRPLRVAAGFLRPRPGTGRGPGAGLGLRRGAREHLRRPAGPARGRTAILAGPDDTLSDRGGAPSGSCYASSYAPLPQMTYSAPGPAGHLRRPVVLPGRHLRAGHRVRPSRRDAVWRAAADRAARAAARADGVRPGPDFRVGDPQTQ